jgi:HK97 family phage portal protein
MNPSLEKRGTGPNSDIINPLPWLLNALGGSLPTISGITVTPLRAMGVATVYACVRVLSDTISTLPLEVHQRKGKQRELSVAHPLFNLLNLQPNEDMSSVNFRGALQSNLSLMSNGYAEIRRDPDGDVTGMYPINSSRMDVSRDPSSGKITYRLNDTSKVLKAENLLHLRHNTLNGIFGLSTTQTVRDVIGLAIALQENASKFFGNGSRPAGVLEHPMSLSPEAQDRLKKQVADSTSGANAYSLLLLEEGMKFSKERSENKDSQFIEAKDAQNLEICRVFGVAPHKVGIQHGSSKGNNIEEENIGFVTDTIRPECIRWEQEMDIKLLTAEERDQGFCCRFDLDALLRTNVAARYDAMAIGRQWGFLSQNDCRSRENLPPIPGGDVYLQPLNMADATKAQDILMKTQQSTKESGSQLQA